MTILLNTFIGSLLVMQLGGIVPSLQAHRSLPGAKAVQVYHSYHAHLFHSGANKPS